MATDTPDGFTSNEAEDAINEVLERLRGRRDMNRRTAFLSPDRDARLSADARVSAYDNAILDVLRVAMDMRLEISFAEARRPR